MFNAVLEFAHDCNLTSVSAQMPHSKRMNVANAHTELPQIGLYSG